MTAYFDQLNSNVHSVSCACPDSELFLEALAEIEMEVIETVNLVTGDREFPADLRERIQGLIAINAVNNGWGKADRKASVARLSPLFQELHSAFHDVASRRHQTRFGMLTDSPRDILTRRDVHDDEEHPEPDDRQ